MQIKTTKKQTGEFAHKKIHYSLLWAKTALNGAKDNFLMLRKLMGGGKWNEGKKEKGKLKDAKIMLKEWLILSCDIQSHTCQSSSFFLYIPLHFDPRYSWSKWPQNEQHAHDYNAYNSEHIYAKCI